MELLAMKRQGGPSANPAGEDPVLAELTAGLVRRQAMFRRYLLFRAGLGLVLAALGCVAIAGAAGIALHAVGAWSWPPLEPWTHGFSGVLATFMPSAFGFICVRTGHSYWRWRHRKVDTADTGCLAG